MKHLATLLKHDRQNIVKEAAWTVSNITAGNVDQIEKVISAGIIQPLLHVLEKVSKFSPTPFFSRKVFLNC